MNTTKKNSSNNTGLTEEEQSIDKVRDILFGVQVRDFEKRFKKLEERFNRELVDARDETNRKLNELEEFLNKEVSALAERVSVEQHTRQDDVKKLSGELKDASHSLDKSITKLGDIAANNESDIRQKILEQSKSLTEEFKKREKDILSRLARETSELRDDKADRTAIAEIFTEIALRLTDKPNSPKKD